MTNIINRIQSTTLLSAMKPRIGFQHAEGQHTMISLILSRDKLPQSIKNMPLRELQAVMGPTLTRFFASHVGIEGHIGIGQDSASSDVAPENDEIHLLAYYFPHMAEGKDLRAIVRAAVPGIARSIQQAHQDVQCLRRN